MLKRFAILTLTLLLLLLGSLNALVWGLSECDFSYSNYARAVQLHDMGDYGPALRHYQCAQLADPDSTIIPLLIQNLHQDSANAASAWSGEGANMRAAPAKFQMPDWLTPYETALDSRRQRQPERPSAVTEAASLDQPVNARQRARAALKAGNLAGAIDWMLKLARADLTAADHDFLASLYSMKGDMARTERSLVQALALAPTRLDLRCELGMLYAQLGDERAALREFDRVLAQDVVDPCAWSNRDALMKRLRDER